MALSRFSVPDEKHPTPKCIIFIGRMGAGKSYLSNQFAERTGLFLKDGDEFISDPVTKLRANLGLAIDRQLIRKFIDDDLIPGIQQLSKNHSTFVLSQALYTNSTRLRIQNLLGGKQNVLFVEVDTPESQRQKQLANRGWGLTGPFWQDYSNRVDSVYEKPSKDINHITITNSKDPAVVEKELQKIPGYLHASKIVDKKKARVTLSETALLVSVACAAFYTIKQLCAPPSAAVMTSGNTLKL